MWLANFSYTWTLNPTYPTKVHNSCMQHNFPCNICAKNEFFEGCSNNNFDLKTWATSEVCNSRNKDPIVKLGSFALLEILSYATTLFATGMQLCRVFYAIAMDFCPLFGCVCNYGATIIAFIPTFGWFLWIYIIVYIPLDVFYRIYLICIYS
jgi:hypothetical protein